MNKEWLKKSGEKAVGPTVAVVAVSGLLLASYLRKPESPMPIDDKTRTQLEAVFQPEAAKIGRLLLLANHRGVGIQDKIKNGAIVTLDTQDGSLRYDITASYRTTMGFADSAKTVDIDMNVIECLDPSCNDKKVEHLAISSIDPVAQAEATWHAYAVQSQGGNTKPTIFDTQLIGPDGSLPRKTDIARALADAPKIVDLAETAIENAIVSLIPGPAQPDQLHPEPPQYA